MIKGVNLGGWLVLEKWLTPSLFKGTTAKDEYSLCKISSKEILARLKNHRKSFVTEDDFAYLQSIGINSVRLPVGYWIFKDHKPYISNIQYLKKALNWGEKYNIKVLVDLHAAKNTQNGLAHSGQICEPNWHANVNNLIQTKDTLKKICLSCLQYKSFLGIEILNEPSYKIPIHILTTFYNETVRECQQILNEKHLIVINELYRPQEIVNLLDTKTKARATLDIHHYQCFSEKDKNKTFKEHIDFLNNNIKSEIQTLSKQMQIIVGEWSLGLDPKSLKGLNKKEIKKAHKRFGKTQMEVYSNTKGWFFWTYKSEQNDNWNFRYLVESKQIKV